MSVAVGSGRQMAIGSLRHLSHKSNQIGFGDIADVTNNFTILFTSPSPFIVCNSFAIRGIAYSRNLQPILPSILKLNLILFLDGGTLELIDLGSLGLKQRGQ